MVSQLGFVICDPCRVPDALWKAFATHVGAGDAMPFVNLMLICLHLERISRHAACVAEQAAGFSLKHANN